MNNKTEWIKMALLGVIAISGVVTASAVCRIARMEFDVVLTVEQADSLLTSASAAKEQALTDMEGEL